MRELTAEIAAHAVRVGERIDNAGRKQRSRFAQPPPAAPPYPIREAAGGLGTPPLSKG